MEFKSLEKIVYFALNNELKQTILSLLNEEPRLIREVISEIYERTGHNLKKMRPTFFDYFEKDLYREVIDKTRIDKNKTRFQATAKYSLTKLGEKVKIISTFLLTEFYMLSQKYKQDIPSVKLMGLINSPIERKSILERKKIINYLLEKGSCSVSELRKDLDLRNLDIHLRPLESIGIINYESVSVGEETGGAEILSPNKTELKKLQILGKNFKTYVLREDLLDILSKEKVVTFQRILKLMRKRWRIKNISERNLENKLEYNLKILGKNKLIKARSQDSSIYFTKKGIDLAKKIEKLGKTLGVARFRRHMLKILEKKGEVTTVEMLDILRKDKKYKKIREKSWKGKFYYSIENLKKSDLIISKKFPSMNKSYISLTKVGEEIVKNIYPKKIDDVIGEIEKGKSPILKYMKKSRRKYSLRMFDEILKSRISVYLKNHLGSKRLPEGEKKEEVYKYIKSKKSGIRPKDIRKRFDIPPNRILRDLRKEERVIRKKVGKARLYFAK